VPWDEDIIKKLCEEDETDINYIPIFKHIIKNNMLWDEHDLQIMCEYAYNKNATDAADFFLWLSEYEIQLPSDPRYLQFIKNPNMQLIIECDNVKLFAEKYDHSSIDSNMEFIFKNNSLNILEWLLKTNNIYISTTKLFNYASRFGTLDSLKLLKKYECEWDESIIINTINRSDINMLQWAVYNKAPWNPEDCISYAKSDEISEWIFLHLSENNYNAEEYDNTFDEY
jgi:hypothetical protein